MKTSFAGGIDAQRSRAGVVAVVGTGHTHPIFLKHLDGQVMLGAWRESVPMCRNASQPGMLLRNAVLVPSGSGASAEVGHWERTLGFCSPVQLPCLHFLGVASGGPASPLLLSLCLPYQMPCPPTHAGLYPSATVSRNERSLPPAPSQQGGRFLARWGFLHGCPLFP